MQRLCKKSRAIASLVQTVGLAIPFSALANLIGKADDDDNDIPLNNIGRMFHRYFENIATPFGSLVKVVQLPLTSGGHIDFQIACPFALLSIGALMKVMLTMWQPSDCFSIIWVCFQECPMKTTTPIRFVAWLAHTTH